MATHMQVLAGLATWVAAAVALPCQTTGWVLEGTVLVPAGLAIESTLPAESIGTTASQTLTFRFTAPVRGFEPADIQVAGATKGAFTEVNPSTYTLEAIGSGGRVTVEVPADVVEPPGNAAASFTNFYQDIRLVPLGGGVTMEFIRIPKGTFMMGSPTSEAARDADERLHQVTLTKDFYLSRTEVTQAQWKAVAPLPQPQHFPGDRKAVHFVSHDDARAWLATLSAKPTGFGPYTLPTESQWEYACRAGTTTRFYFGDAPGANDSCSAEQVRVDNMWYCGNYGAFEGPTWGVKEVGLKLPNRWGLFDMHGNVGEWCADGHGPYPEGPVTDPDDPFFDTFYPVRGGSWIANFREARSADRFATGSDSRDFGTGIRVCVKL